MSELNSLYIAAMSMITPIGADSKMTAASQRAGISAYSFGHYANSQLAPMKSAWVPDDALPALDDELQNTGLKSNEKRIIQLCHNALNQIEPELSSQPALPLFFAMPENIPARVESITLKLPYYIQQQSKVTFNVEQSRLFSTGRAGVLQAIEYAFQYLSNSNEDCVLVGGADSYCNAGLLTRLDAEGRILAENIANGFTPAEGAAFLLLSKTPRNNSLPVQLARPGIADEKGHRYNDEEPYLGEGLAAAVKTAIQQGNKQQISHLYSSMNGESMFAKEHGVVELRNARSFLTDKEVSYPADCYGDLGAATGAVLIGLSALQLSSSETATPYQHLVVCSSDMADRAAICISHTSDISQQV